MLGLDILYERTLFFSSANDQDQIFRWLEAIWKTRINLRGGGKDCSIWNNQVTENALGYVPLNRTDNKTTLVQIMAWWHQWHFYKHGLTLIPAWISNHMTSKVWDEFPNVNSATVQVWEWISHFTPQFIMDVITYPLVSIWFTTYFIGWWFQYLHQIKGFHIDVDSQHGFSKYKKKSNCRIYLTYRIA